MKREFILTADGSTSIFLPEWEEQYHSRHGAIREAEHVFIKNGWDCSLEQKETGTANEPLKILELGFGTGLNAFLTFLKAETEKVKTQYTTVEAFPLPIEEINKLNYTSLLSAKNHNVFRKLHELPWEKKHGLSDYFTFKKIQEKLEGISIKEKFDLIYFDAFSPRVQPELWTTEIFEKMYGLLSEDGILTTYCAKGNVRRAMQAVGFEVERLPGPPGKREMLRARKGSSHSTLVKCSVPEKARGIRHQSNDSEL